MKSSIFTRHIISVCQDSSVDIMIGYRLHSGGLILGSARFFSSPVSRMAVGPNKSPIQCILGALSPGDKADHSPPSSAEVKNGVAIPPFPHMSSQHSA
jgi:hypothetical protein